MDRRRLVKLGLALVVVAAASFPTTAGARQVEGFSVTNPPGYGEKTFDPITENVLLFGLLGPPTYDECRLETTEYCHSIPIHFDAGRPNGHKTTFTLTWPGEQAANNLDMILWNESARAECSPDLDNLFAFRFCGSEGRAIGTSYPERIVLYDLPAGDYTLTVWSVSGTNAGYTVRGDIELFEIHV
jgi:hypothetical protein